MKDLIFIEGSFPSFKNSKQYVGGRLIMSKTVQKYLKNYEYQWRIIPPSFSLLDSSDYPILVGIHFVRGTKHRYDFHNGVQGVADMLVKHNWIPDDSMFYFFPVPLELDKKYFSYSKDRPGVYIKILNTKLNE